MIPPQSRRSALGLAGVGLVTVLSGCSFLSTPDKARYSLMSSPSGGTTLTDLFAWEPTGRQLHLRRNADAITAAVLDSGGVTTESQPVAPYAPDGPAPPAYAEREGAYYRVRVTAVEDVSLDRWEFWFEPVDDPPADADPVENPTAGLSELDAEIVERAIDDAIGAVVGDDDPSAAPHGERGVVYFEPMAPDRSDLVPDPPFEYVRVDPDTEFLDEDRTLRARAETGRVETRRYVHETERVAESHSELDAILSGHVDATFDDADGGVRDIVAEISDGGVYAERGPISGPFERVLERLDVDDPSPPDEPESVRTWRRHYAYADRYYRVSLRIRND